MAKRGIADCRILNPLRNLVDDCYFNCTSGYESCPIYCDLIDGTEINWRLSGGHVPGRHHERNDDNAVPTDLAGGTNRSGRRTGGDLLDNPGLISAGPYWH